MGSSLIEVMLAVSLTAVTMLGLAAAQLGTTREAQVAALREQATWIADSLVEAMRAPTGADVSLRQWSDRAPVLLPHGEVSIVEQGGVSRAQVMWAASPRSKPDGSARNENGCAQTTGPVGTACIFMIFAR